MFAIIAPCHCWGADPGSMKYTALQKINLFTAIYGRMFAAIIKPRIWIPFFILALFQVVALYGLAKFYLPGWFNIIFPILSSFLPPEVLHYPQYYLALPAVYSGLDNFIIGPTVWVVLSAVAVYKLGGYYAGENSPLGEGFKSVFGAYLPLLIFWAIETALVLLVMLVPSLLIADLVRGSPRRKIALDFGLQVIGFGVSAFLIYTIPGIIFAGTGVGSAIKKSLRLCWKNFFLTFFIIFIPSVLNVFFNIIFSEFSPRIIQLLNPELIIALLGLQIGIGIFINLFIYGSAVFVYKEMA